MHLHHIITLKVDRAATMIQSCFKGRKARMEVKTLVHLEIQHFYSSPVHKKRGGLSLLFANILFLYFYLSFYIKLHTWAMCGSENKLFNSFITQNWRLTKRLSKWMFNLRLRRWRRKQKSRMREKMRMRRKKKTTSSQDAALTGRTNRKQNSNWILIISVFSPSTVCDPLSSKYAKCAKNLLWPNISPPEDALLDVFTCYWSSDATL